MPATAEVFDDVAFFFVLYAVVGLAVVPATSWWALSWLSGKLFSSDKTAAHAPAPSGTPVVHQINVKAGAAGIAAGAVCNCAECQRKRRLLTAEKAQGTSYLTPGWIVFGLLWVLFIYLSLQLPSYQGSQMVQFEPFQVLGLDHSATEREISKAYRQMSLKYHPDKNPGDAEAAQQFLLVSRAYQALTDPVAMENIKKFGNPDGYQGSKVGIGLPRWLVESANANVILIVYFLAIILLPSIAVFWWWRSAKQFHETGVMKETVGAYYNFLPDTVSVKYLIELLAASAEYRQLDKTPTDPVLFRKLINEVKDAMVKQKFPHPYIFKANHLLHAYMMRVVQCVPIDGPIGAPAVNNTPGAAKEEEDAGDVADVNSDLVVALSKNKFLQNDLRLVLKPAHRLLHTMYEMALAKGYVKTAFCVIELMQLLTQAMWVHDSPLRQLPHLSDKEIHFAGKKGFNDLTRFRSASDKDKQKVFRAHSDAEWADINTVAGLLPDVEVDHKHEVEDETGLYEGDVVLLTVTLTRSNIAALAPDAVTATVAKADAKAEATKPAPSAPAAAAPAPAADAKASNGDAKAAAPDAATTGAAANGADGKAAPAADGAAAGAGAGADGKSTPTAEEDDEEDEDEDDEKIFALAQRPNKKQHLSESDLMDAHAVRFPFPKKERWYVVLVYTNARGQEVVVAQEKILNFQLQSSVKLRFQAPDRKGTYNYELFVKCDSYVGCDRQSTVKLVVDSAPADVKAKADAAPDPSAPGSGAHDDGDAEHEEPPETKWYYLWHTSFWELLLNVVILSVAGFFLFDWLQRRGYWDAYFDPVLQRAGKFLAPVTAALQPVYATVLAPIVAWLDRVTTRTFKPDHERAEGAKDGAGAGAGAGAGSGDSSEGSAGGSEQPKQQKRRAGRKTKA